jgi:hypothetical protein
MPIGILLTDLQQVNQLFSISLVLRIIFLMDYVSKINLQ